MNTQLQTFNFNSHALRVITDEHGAPWFIAKDVADTLEYSDAQAMTRKLDEDEVKKANLQNVGLHNNQTLISESGLYSATLSSNKPEAKAFKKFITAEVLPSIRKTGGYSLALPQTYAAALRQLADETEAKEAALAKIEADKPKVEFAEIVTEDSNTRCVRVWVKAMKHENNLTVGEQQVFKWLLDNRYIFKDGGGYLPYAKYEANGANYFTVVIDDINGKPRRQLKITGKGVVALTGKVVKAFSQPRNGLVLLQGAQA